MTGEQITPGAVVAEWARRYSGTWRGYGVGCRAYAHVVAEQRLGRRKTLSYGYYVGKHDEARPEVRRQVDRVIADLKTGDGEEAVAR